MSAVVGAEPAKPLSLPYRTDIDDLFIVDVEVNDTGPHPFVVDTGATSTALSGALATQLGLADLSRDFVIVHGVAESGLHPTTKLTTLRLGHEVRREPTVIVLKKQQGTRSWSGVLGLDILDDYVAVFQKDPNTLTLFHRSELAADYFDGWQSLDVYHDASLRRPYRLMFLNVLIDGVPMEALFDLGSSTPIINWAGARKLGYGDHYTKLREDWVIKGAVGRFRPESVIEVKQVQAGLLRSVGSLLVADTPALRELNRADKPLIILSTGFFRRLEFAVDAAKPALYVRLPVPSGVAGQETGNPSP